MKPVTIGGLARSAGVNVETIRFYQRRGLVPQPKRPPGGVRRYGEDAAQRLRFIKKAQDIGFSLGEVAELLKLQRGCRGAHDLAVSKLSDVERRMADLARVRKTLVELIGRCERERSVACPIIDALQ
jgi:MerR family mercuric resistance operon transcriptional regulator